MQKTSKPSVTLSLSLSTLPSPNNPKPPLLKHVNTSLSKMKFPKVLSPPFFFIFSILLTILDETTSHKFDGEILLQVKTLQILDPNQNLTNWIPSSHSPCNWTGIKCAPRSSSVVSINLNNLDVSSKYFPSAFCKISTLQTLSLSNNSFGNTVSSEQISSCSHLHYLDLSNNLFVGPLPNFTTTFPNLRYLDLSFNNFSGDIPPSFGRFLPNLQVLNLTSNLITGPVVPTFLTNLTALTHLQSTYNYLLSPSQLPSEIGNLTKLELLWLSATSLTGDIPESIGRLESLKYLDLTRNAITGKIPQTIGNLKNVHDIELYNNLISGELPESLGNLSNLRTFDASMNNLTGKLPEKLAGLQLTILRLTDNHLEGEIPKSLASNENLIELQLYNNSFSGVLPVDLGRSSPLEKFDVSNNRFVGNIPPFLCAGKKLYVFITFNNRFSGTLPKSIAECESLGRIRICNSGFSGKVPDSFWGLPRVYLLEMCSNRFKGSISPAISGAGELLQLIVAGNNFSGEMPVEICRLQNLVKLDARRNRFFGELPTCITDLKNLQYLDLQENMFSGNILHGVSSWSKLTELNLSGNAFTGEIPRELGELPVLTYLDLTNNSFSGNIPNELTNLKLNRLNLSGNKLEGRIPLGFDNEFFLYSLVGNPNLCSSNLKSFPHCSHSKAVNWFLAAVIICSCLLILLTGYFFNKSKRTGGKGKSPWKLTSFYKMSINEEEIFASIRDENLIGIGSSGKVYRVRLKSGQTVAVKKLWSGSGKPETETVFMSEVETLGRIRHSNIVKLLFTCTGEDFRVLVYEYMQNGSLGDALHSEKGGVLLDWPKRLTIAVGAAHGIAYLHHDCQPAIVHRDVKANNILLDENFHPRVADFGLAKILQGDKDQGENIASRIAGSYGYIAPEYAYTLKVTEKSDVYSFGVVLMELVTGKRPIDPSFGETNKDIVKWVNDASFASQGNRNGGQGSILRQIMDTRMNPSPCDYEEMEKVLNVALLCTSAFPLNRPSMRKVVDMLKNHKEINYPAPAI